MKTIEAKNREEWRRWLEEHTGTEKEIFLVYYKKHTGKPTVSYAESVEEALCFGWIDGRAQKIDEERWAQRFTPRKPKSIWSKSNVERVNRLIAEGRMTGKGMQLVEDAKRSGEWEKAYRTGDDLEVPPVLQKALQQNPVAWENFQQYAPSNRHIFITRVTTAKTPPTLQRRLQKIVELCEQKLLPYDKDRKMRI